MILSYQLGVKLLETKPYKIMLAPTASSTELIIHAEQIVDFENVLHDYIIVIDIK